MSRLARELMTLVREPLEGIRLSLDEYDSLSTVHIYLLGPEGTPYENGCFKIKMHFTDEFPSVPPKCYFLTKLFHPNVHPSTGEICVNTLKKDWTQQTGIAHTLLTIKCLLIVPNAESALNEDAGKMLLDAYDEYARRAKMMTSIHAEKVMGEYRELFEKEKDKDSENSVPAGESRKEEGNVLKRPAEKEKDKKKVEAKKRSLKRL